MLTSRCSFFCQSDFMFTCTGTRFFDDPFCFKHLREIERRSKSSLSFGKFFWGTIVWHWSIVFLIILVILVIPSYTLLLASTMGAKMISFSAFLVLLNSPCVDVFLAGEFSWKFGRYLGIFNEWGFRIRNPTLVWGFKRKGLVEMFWMIAETLCLDMVLVINKSLSLPVKTCWWKI